MFLHPMNRISFGSGWQENEGRSHVFFIKCVIELLTQYSGGLHIMDSSAKIEFHSKYLRSCCVWSLEIVCILPTQKHLKIRKALIWKDRINHAWHRQYQSKRSSVPPARHHWWTSIGPFCLTGASQILIMVWGDLRVIFCDEWVSWRSLLPQVCWNTLIERTANMPFINKWLCDISLESNEKQTSTAEIGLEERGVTWDRISDWRPLLTSE